MQMERHPKENPKKILIFDFNHTIVIDDISTNEAVVSFSTVLENPKYYLSDLFQDREFLFALQNFQKNGNIIAIVSFGKYNLISEYLKNINVDVNGKSVPLIQFFDRIFTAKNIPIMEVEEGKKYGFDIKSMLIGKIQENYHEPKNRNLMVVEYDDLVYQDIKDNDYRAVKTHMTGLSEKDKPAILKFINT